MTKDDLIARQQKSETKFDELTQQAQDIQVELNRLQGEYRILTEQIDNWVDTSPKEAEVIPKGVK